MAPFHHFKGNRSPSISDTITIDGVAFDLTSSTVKFRMRLQNSNTLKVDAAATIISAPAGTVRYDWAAADVDTAGDYLAWWQVTLPSAKTQDTPEFEISIDDHVVAVPGLYVQVEELKSTLELTGENFADEDVIDALSSASRAVEQFCGRRFYPDTDANQVRYYTPRLPNELYIDDLVQFTSLKVDTSGSGSFTQTWTQNNDFVLGPFNAPADGQPWIKIEATVTGSFLFIPGFPRSVQVTGMFGWLTTPAEVKTATSIMASRLIKRAREVPFGIAGIGLDGSAVRISAVDPDVTELLVPYQRGPGVPSGSLVLA